MSLYSDIKKYWFILFPIIGVVFGFIAWQATVNIRLSSVEAQSSENGKQLQVITQMQSDIAVIKNDVQYLKANLK